MPARPPQISIRRPAVIGHRGAPAEAPENTLAAFRAALAAGVDGVELDVRVTRDGVPVVFHDDTLRRLAGRRGRIAELDWPGVRGLRVLGREPVPRLADVLRLFRDRLVQIEIKAGVPVAPVVAAVRAARAARRVILASFVPDLVADAARLAPRIPRMLIAERWRPRAWLARQLAATGAAGLSIDHRAVTTPEFVARFHDRGLAVWCWTVNRPADFRRVARCGVDAVIGDNPRLLCALLESGIDGR